MRGKKYKVEYIFLICVCLHDFYLSIYSRAKKRKEEEEKDKKNEMKRILPEGIFHLVMTQNRRTKPFTH